MSMRKMQAEIVTVGNELLNGRTENTNASFLSRELQNIGLCVTNHTADQGPSAERRESRQGAGDDS